MEKKNKKEKNTEDGYIKLDINDLEKQDDEAEIDPREMYKILKEVAGGDMPAPMTVRVKYSSALQHLTGKDSEDMFMSYGAPFAFLLESVLETYPKLATKYGPGKLCFQVNGKSPAVFEPLLDEDEVRFFSVSEFSDLKYEEK
ncbi:MAG: hypothetical protein PHX25_03085 [Candidatus Pacebacteria bacterium]|nr:hypothetical protein [Candidatus Paceibacterota bacterium]